MTYGAGGSENQQRNPGNCFRCSKHIRYRECCPPSLHRISMKSEVLHMLARLEASWESITSSPCAAMLIPPWLPNRISSYASDLVSFIKQNGDFNIIGACYPEGHSECPSLDDDIRNLKNQGGCREPTSSLPNCFLTTATSIHFGNEPALPDIHVPIEAGIMPAVNKKQIDRMVSLCGVKLPKKFVIMMEKYRK